MTEFIQSFGVLAPIIYVLMFMFLPIFFFPVPILAVAGGVAFGFVEGSLLTFVGASLNCYIMFVISRRFGREWVKNYLKKKMTPKQHDRIFNVSDEKLMMSEKVGHRSFYIWGKFLLKCGQISPRFRRVVLYFYILFLIILILTVVPLSAVIKRLLKPLLKEKLARQKRYFAEPSGE